MKTWAISNLAALLMMGAIVQAAPAAASSAEGLWTMQNGKVTVKVSDCGEGICGTIVALKKPISKITGKPKVDRENPDPSLRHRPVIGISILFDMKAIGDGKWQGKIYNPDDGRTYNATVRFNDGAIEVKGCVLGMLCKTNTFVRAY